MKCVLFRSIGPPSEVLEVSEQDAPAPDRSEVRVRMLAAPINPSDLMFIEGIYGKQPSLPQIPGFEGVGIVEENGGGLRGRMFLGKRVAVLHQNGGNWAEQVIVPAKQVIPLSSRLTTQQAATFFVNPATAWATTQEVLQIPRGAWLLQTAAASNLGQMIVRLGKRMGFRTLNIVRNRTQVDLLKSQGADEVIVFDAEQSPASELHTQVNSIVCGGGVKFAIDPVGGKLANAVLQTLGLGGQLLLFGTLSEQPLQFSPRDLMTRQATVTGFWLGNFMQSKSLLFKLKLVRRLTKLILDGTLATQVGETFRLEDIEKATTATDRLGKTLLLMNES